MSEVLRLPLPLPLAAIAKRRMVDPMLLNLVRRRLHDEGCSRRRSDLPQRAAALAAWTGWEDACPGCSTLCRYRHHVGAQHEAIHVAAVAVNADRDDTMTLDGAAALRMASSPPGHDLAEAMFGSSGPWGGMASRMVTSWRGRQVTIEIRQARERGQIELPSGWIPLRTAL